MAPYLTIFSLLSIFAVLDHVKEFRRNRLVFFLLSFLILFLFAGLRKAGVGADDGTYVNKFLSIPDISYWLSGEFKYTFKETWLEPAYVFIGSSVKYFSTNYTYLFLVVAFISVSVAVYNYYRYSPYVFLTLLLFFSHTYLYREMNQIRAGIVAGMGLFLFRLIAERKHAAVFIMIGISSLFHMAALSFFFPYFLSFFRQTKARYYLIQIAAFVIGYIGISKLLVTLLPGMGYITVKLNNYAQSSAYGEAIGLLDITNIKNIFIFNTLLFLYHRLEPKVPYFRIMMLFMFLGTVWRIAFSDFEILAGRVATFFTISEVILVPSIILAFKQKVFVTVLVIIYAFIQIYLNMYSKNFVNMYHISIF